MNLEISGTLGWLMMAGMLIFPVFLILVVALIRKKSNAAFDKNINLNATDYTLYGIYKSGVVLAYVTSTVSAIVSVILSIFVHSWITVVLLTMTMFIIIFLGFIDYIPNFLFKCPKCEERKLVHFRKVTLSAIEHYGPHSKGIKKVYFKCKECEFEALETVNTWQH